MSTSASQNSNQFVAGESVSIRESYSRRAKEYVRALGSVADMDATDAEHIATWGTALSGTILDAGCGPGHWTELLRAAGCDVYGADLVPAFVASARERFPLARFVQADFLAPVAAFEAVPGALGGVLAWYSLIHAPVRHRRAAVARLARMLKPGGTMLIAGFLGPDGEPFNHAITRAYYWSEAGLAADLEHAGMRVIDVRTRVPKDARPHVALTARRTEPAP